MCGFDAECVAIVANVRFFLIVATIVTHLRQNHTPFFTVHAVLCILSFVALSQRNRVEIRMATCFHLLRIHELHACKPQKTDDAMYSPYRA